MRQLALAVVIATAACAAVPAGESAARQIVDDLAARRYTQAGARYRQQQDVVLSPEAAAVWRVALQHQDTAVRELAIDALSRIGAPGDFELLQKALRDPMRGVRQQARDGLVRLDSRRAVGVMRQLIEDVEPEVVLLGAEGAAMLRDGEAVGALCSRFVDADLPAPTRAALALPIARIGDPAAVTTLVGVALDTDADIALRRAAAEAAAALATTAQLEAMRAMAVADDPFVRELGAVAVEAIR